MRIGIKKMIKREEQIKKGVKEKRKRHGRRKKGKKKDGTCVLVLNDNRLTPHLFYSSR